MDLVTKLARENHTEMAPSPENREEQAEDLVCRVQVVGAWSVDKALIKRVST